LPASPLPPAEDARGTISILVVKSYSFLGSPRSLDVRDRRRVSISVILVDYSIRFRNRQDRRAIRADFPRRFIHERKPMANHTPKTERAKVANELQAEFLRHWNQSDTIDEVAHKMNVPVASMIARETAIRRRGEELKCLPRAKPADRRKPAPYTPTPEMIAEQCAIFRARWSKEELYNNLRPDWRPTRVELRETG
jgi:hypothetical protein